MTISGGLANRRLGLLGSVVCMVVLVFTTPMAQRSNVAALLGRLQLSEPLAAREVRDLVVAAREALGYKSLRLAFSPTGLPGVEVLMGSDGRPLFTREIGRRPDWRAFAPSRATGVPQSESVTLTHYTRRAATRCGGTLTADELVIDYRSDGAGWSATTRLVTPREFGAPIFSVLAGEVPLSDAGRNSVMDRQTRELRAPWSPPDIRTTSPLGGVAGVHELQGLVAPKSAASAIATQVLSIDEGTLLPLRWSLVTAAARAEPSQSEGYQVYFIYDPALTVGAPPGVDVPTCVR